jgi:hypothetical protein
MPSHEPEETVELKGYAQASKDGPMIPVSIKVPPGHPYLTMREGESYSLATYGGEVVIHSDTPNPVDLADQPTTYSRMISQAVAEHAMEQVRYAEAVYRSRLDARLEVLRQPLTAAIQARLREYFGECQRDGRRPLTWDSAAYAAEAALAALAEELTP